MSRIDYITIGIVSVCVIAIGFLVYKMTDLFSSQDGGAPVETTQNTVEVEEEGDVYDYETDAPLDTAAAEEPANDNTSRPAETSTQAGRKQTPPPAAQPAAVQQPARETTPRETASGETSPADPAPQGSYMVFAGTFKQKINAEKRLDQLKENGHDNATIEIFDRGRYAVVIAGRFDNMQDAEALKEKLLAEGFNALIKVKE